MKTVLLFASLWCAQPDAAVPTALLGAADQARGATATGLTWLVRIESTQDGDTQERVYEVRVKGDRALARCNAPARCRGESILSNEHALWLYRQGLRKPVLVSARQRMLGQMAVGDIASTRYASDYTATLLGEELMEGVLCSKLALVAKSADATYERATYWVDKARGVGVRADFLTVQGDVFKTAVFVYDNHRQENGRRRPFISRMDLRDAQFPDNISRVTYELPHAAALSDTEFNVNNLHR